MPRLLLSLISLVLVTTGRSPVAAAPSPSQRCEGDVELASAKYSQCRLTVESKYSKGTDAEKRAAALVRCSDRLQQSFAKAVARYGLNCTGVPVAEFDTYLTQCSDDAAAAAAGASLPDYVGDLGVCDANLSACSDVLASCDANLSACHGALATCEIGTPLAQLLQTGQSTSYGPGSDGDLQIGAGRAYVDNGDGTITDTKTGLIWEKKSDDGSIHDKDDSYSWPGASYGTTNTMDGTVATTFLAGLNASGGFAGYTDWRLPNVRELESIVHLENVNPAVATAFNMNCGANSSGNPGCSVTTCSCTLHDDYWSSSTYSLGPAAAWIVSFTVGQTFPYAKMGSGGLHVRAVRGGS